MRNYKPKKDSEGLSVKQRLFVDYYIQTANATESAKRAGYSSKTAYSIGQRLLTKVELQEAIRRRTAELETERTAKAQEILEYLASVMRGEATEEVVMNIGTGKGYTKAEKVKAQVSAKDRLKAAEMLAKVNGMFITKQEIELNGALPVVIADDF